MSHPTVELVHHISVIILGVLGFSGSTAQLVVFCRSKKPKRPFDITMTSLRVADIFLSVLSIVDGVVFFIETHDHKSLFSSVYLFGLHFVMGSMIFHMLFIALERLVAVRLPMKFQQLITIRRSITFLIVSWFLSIGIAILEDRDFFNFGFSVIFNYSIFASGLIAVIMYSAICYFERKNQVAVAVGPSQTSPNRHNRGLVIHSVVVTMSFMLCTFPYAILTLKSLEQTYPETITQILLPVQPCVNAALFFLKRCKIKCPLRSTEQATSTTTSRLAASTEERANVE
eukprot:gene18248-20068_t